MTKFLTTACLAIAATGLLVIGHTMLVDMVSAI